MQDKLLILDNIKTIDFNAFDVRLWVIKKAQTQASILTGL